MLFSGEYECKIDVKGRLLLPARLKARLPESEEALVIVRGFEPCLVAYPLSAWQVIAARVDSLDEFAQEQRRFQRSYLRGATECELDGQGRILIPRTMMPHAGLTDTVMAVGVSNRIELWEPAQYLKYLTADQAELSAAAERILGRGNTAPASPSNLQSS